MPKDLLHSWASLFDDPDYSDVVFRIRPAGGQGRERRLYAAKKVLVGRSSYFETMFSSGFHESTAVPDSLPPSPRRGSQAGTRFFELQEEEEGSDYDEDEDDLSEEDDTEYPTSEYAEGEREAALGLTLTSGDLSPVLNRKRTDSSLAHSEVDADELPSRSATPDAPAAYHDAPASPARAPPAGATRSPARRTTPDKPSTATDSRPRIQVVIEDSSYLSFKALLYYLYTDSICFSPLASTYHAAREAAQQSGTPFPFSTRRSYLSTIVPPTHKPAGPGVPGPCSAKAIYRLADKLDLPELKERASEHIVKSLSTDNIAYEVFGSFSLRFEEIKRREMAFLLEHWNEVRGSGAMRRILASLRDGRWPGFEDVWSRSECRFGRRVAFSEGVLTCCCSIGLARVPSAGVSGRGGEGLIVVERDCSLSFARSSFCLRSCLLSVDLPPLPLAILFSSKLAPHTPRQG